MINDFANNSCKSALQLAPLLSEKLARGERLDPLVVAVIASCEPPKKDPERFFAYAEKLDPSNDAIALLHARYAWKHDPQNAKTLWHKVLLLSRNPTVKHIAQDYLDADLNDARGDNNELGQINRKWSYTVNLQAGIASENNPEKSPDSEAGIPASTGFENVASLGIERKNEAGSITANYTLTRNDYPQAHAADYTGHNLEVPFAVRAGTNEDIVVKPLSEYSFLGNAPFNFEWGLGVAGVAYREKYKQSVQAQIYREQIYPVSSAAQGGTHFRFEYEWDLFYDSDTVLLQPYVEHVTAGLDNSGVSGQSIYYSHTDIGGQFNIEHDFKKFRVNLAPKFTLREDSDDSSFFTTDTNKLITKRRQDFQYGVQVGFTLPVWTDFQIFAWYEWDQTLSNFGSTDYQDQNERNQILGIALQLFTADKL